MANEELNDKIKQIMGILGKDKVPDGVTDLISSFIESTAKGRPGGTSRTGGTDDTVSANDTGADEGIGDARETKDASDTADDSAVLRHNSSTQKPRIGSMRNETGTDSDNGNTDDTARLIMTLVEGLRSTDDYRIKFLTSIKPLLSKRRQDKVNNCIQILKLAKMSKSIFSDYADNGEGI